MLLVVIARTTPELEAKAWKRSAERRVPLPDNVKIIEQYVLLGQNKTIAIVDALDATTVAKSALNWADEADTAPGHTVRSNGQRRHTRRGPRHVIRSVSPRTGRYRECDIELHTRNATPFHPLIEAEACT